MRESVTLVGAGPVGSLLSVFLARAGFTVKIWEGRPDPRREKFSAGRSINLALSTRGLHALRQMGLREAVLARAVPMRGRQIHQPDGSEGFQAYGSGPDDCIYSVSRAELNNLLLTEAERSGVRVEFKQKARGADFFRQTLILPDHLEPFDYLIGTDGSASALRESLRTQVPEFHSTEARLTAGYKELQLPAGSGFARNALHIWPRGQFMLIALPNFDGTFTCTLFLPLEGAVSFASLREPGQVTSFFRTHFADAPIRDLDLQFFANPTGHMVTVKCTPWNAGGRGLLLGDAAHGIVPFFGQGMNAGFEDCTQFADQVARLGLEPTIRDFGAHRRPDTDAIADMATENFVEMRDRVAQPDFQLQKKVEHLLHERFGPRYVSRYELVTFSQTPYREAYRIGQIQQAILAELCRGLSDERALDFARAERLIAEKLGI